MESADAILYVANRLDDMGTSASDVKLVGLVESAQALLQLPHICPAHRRLEALIFGADDYASDVGATYVLSNV